MTTNRPVISTPTASAKLGGALPEKAPSRTPKKDAKAAQMARAWILINAQPGLTIPETLKETGVSKPSVVRMRNARHDLLKRGLDPRKFAWDEVRLSGPELQAHSEPAYITRGKEIERLAREAAVAAYKAGQEVTPADATASTLPVLQGTVTGRFRHPGGDAAKARQLALSYGAGPATLARVGLVPSAQECAEQPTMSSREIAELTGKRHADVLRDIRNMLDDLQINASKFASVYVDAKGEKRSSCRLPKDLTITLVSSYNVTMRHRIVTRWMELEEAAKPAAPVVSSDPLRTAKPGVKPRL